MSCDMDKFCLLLDEKNMTNKDHYKNVIRLSQKLKYQISQLKMKSHHPKTTMQLEKPIQSNHHSNTTCDSKNISLLLQKSPTETLMTYYDNTPTMANVHNSKPLPPITPELYEYKSFDSAVEISQQQHQQQLPPKPPPKNKSTFSLHIIQTHKKYSTLFHHILHHSTYHLEHLIVYNKSPLTALSPYMVASQDKITGEKKMVLKLILHMTTPNDLTIDFPHNTKKKKRRKKSKGSKKKNLDYEILLHDQAILQQLELFISQQPLLPLLVHASHVFRDGYKLYVVYNYFFELTSK